MIKNYLPNFFFTSFQVSHCSFRLNRNSTEYLVMFFTDIMLFYFIPLLISVVLYSLIGRMLLFKSKSKFPGGGTRNSLSASAAQKTNQSRIQVRKLSEYTHICIKDKFLIEIEHRISSILNFAMIIIDQLQ